MSPGHKLSTFLYPTKIQVMMTHLAAQKTEGVFPVSAEHPVKI